MVIMNNIDVRSDYFRSRLLSIYESATLKDVDKKSSKDIKEVIEYFVKLQEVIEDYKNFLIYNGVDIDSKNTKEEESKTNKENIVKLLEEGILNGYDENDMHREFDVLDYLIITKIPVTKMDCLDLYSIDRKARDFLHTIKRKYI